MAPPGLSRVRGFQELSLFFEALTMSGVLLSTWFCVLRHSRPLATCLPACHLLPTPEPARPAPHPVSSCSALIPPNSTLHPLTFLDWGPLSLLQLLLPPESHLRHDPSPLTPRRSPQPLGASHRTPSSRRDSDGGKCGEALRRPGLGRRQAWPKLTQSPSRPLFEANSVASYENEGASGIRGAWVGWGGWGPSWARLTLCCYPQNQPVRMRMRMRMRTTITIRATCEWPGGRWEVRAKAVHPPSLTGPFHFFSGWCFPTALRPLALPPHQLLHSAPLASETVPSPVSQAFVFII